MSLRTPLARARGLGSAHDGTSHFWWQRLTGAANLIALIFFVYTVFSLAGASHAEVQAYFDAPLAGALMLLLIVSVSYHMYLGMQTIIEDYVHSSGSRVVALALNALFSVFIALASVLAVLKLSLGA
ncbi:succinate dehydrogenase, hydrophobic membrane anchor protein [Dichotomicrobium thermohalophilum]|uniref:Succinate dehydrogenase hydrophobic membrane anchor subunit n=1 Tax=Dichotomicrobium thermohalophilum TaxID=933063 RepID=A0A397QET7_9HYPH|nr:succinate dehydrogenase, hydrophobic membrane anchor protein [Dichotomicrobium thermohalophilum]RIA56801.1 succinate dehydrogenase subunit D [Dichotomicrobium thermohalophilum]